MNPSRFHFLLGGADLEMKEIQKLLEELHIPFENAGLSWNNAQWDFYTSRIEELLKKDEDLQVIGVELLGKKNKPEHPRIIDIDHHNFERCKPTSIEQIAELLGIELNDWQKKVAVNDKAYIPGLLDEGVSIAEIGEIRRKDREAQGLTETDFAEARNYLKENPPKEDRESGLFIWKLPDDAGSFTPYTDAFFFKKLDECLNTRKDNGEKTTPKDCARELKKIKIIFYNGNKFHYSGYIPAEIIKKYENEIKEDKNGYSRAFFGGAHDSGYFGFAPEYVKEKGAENLLGEWKEVFRKNKPDLDKVKKEEMYSYHVFLFPFRWDLLNNTKKFTEKIKLTDFHQLLMESGQWQNEPYNPAEKAEFYNEYVYFYDFVRDAIFETGRSDKKILKHYEYRLPEKSHYVIYTQSGKVFKLPIDHIYLHVFSTGVGLLSFHLKNDQCPDLQSIIDINEFGRRIYPQFLSDSPSGKKPPTSQVKNTFLAHTIEIDTIPGSKEDFSFYEKLFPSSETVYKLPNFISTLLGKNFTDNDKEKNKILIRPVVDDRMFVISWFGNNNFSKRLSKKKNISLIHRITGTQFLEGISKTEQIEYTYLSDKDWYRFLFIDREEPMLQHDMLIKEYLNRHTYARFADYGTLYGISRYSFMLVTNESDFAKEILLTHLRTMYYQMVVLSLMQRASILRFSDEVTEISKESNEEIQSERIKILNKEYLKFINTMYFREVTAQEQGIELYDMIQEHMRIERDVKDLNREIDELYQFDSMIASERESKEMKIHTVLATLFLPAMLISGILGMNIWDKNLQIPKFLFSWHPNFAFWTPVMLIYAAYFSYELFFKKKDKKWKNKSIWFWIGFILWIIVLIYLIYAYFKMEV